MNKNKREKSLKVMVDGMYNKVKMIIL